MPFVNATMATNNSYDVIVVGSGAGGGQMAYTLTMDGASVLMLEAGRRYDPVRETPMFQTPDQAPLRDNGTPDKHFSFYDANVGGGWRVPGEPYAQVSAEPSAQFDWWRSRMLGGRTNHWGRYVFRNGPYDFKGRSRDGLGFDWPISYEEIAPYYDRVEQLIGVYGSNEGLENTPNSGAGCLLPPPVPLVSDLLVQRSGKSLGIPVVASHRAVLTQQLDWKTLPAKLHPGNPSAQRILALDMKRRASCIWATPCERGCSIRANYQSTTVHLPPALETGRLDILTDAMVYEVTLARNGRASGVAFIDKETQRHCTAKARVVVLAASSCESARILLNSKSGLFPNGLGNSSGRVGNNLMDSVGTFVTGQVPLLENLPAHNQDGDSSGGHLYIPWWLYGRQLSGEIDFPRGYHIQFSGGRSMPDATTSAGLEWLTKGSYGQKFKQDARRYYGSLISFMGCGEMIPNERSYCELDPAVKDRWGIPVLRFHWGWSDFEIRQVMHMRQTCAAIITGMGGRVYEALDTPGAQAILPGGSMIHEVGGCMMGVDSRKSVTNKWCQTWDVRNVFLADGSPFPSGADKNPTLTIMANAWRVADHILDSMRRRDL